MNRIVRFSLLPFALLYGLIIKTRNWLYAKGILPSTHFPVKVISIGNISVGGTGKTPMAEYLLRELIARGYQPAYLSRGYGRKTTGYVAVQPTEHTATEVGDEALQVATKFAQVPVAVCEKRVVGVQQLLAQYAIDAVVLDDAFQHRAIARDMDIVMVDANRPPWADWLLPAGRLREPQASIDRSDMVVVNKIKSKKQVPQYKHRFKKPTVMAQLRPVGLHAFADNAVIHPEQINRLHCLAFSALGNNQDFYNDLRNIGLVTVKSFAFKDHHFFTQDDLKPILKLYKRITRHDVFEAQPIIVTTEKDYMRLSRMPWFAMQMAQFPFYYLAVALDIIEGKEIFAQCLNQIVPQHEGARSASL